MSNKSESIKDLAAALAKAQGKITGALKDSANPFFKSKYADLASVWDACRGPLSENGLCVIQTTAETEQGTVLVTTLSHSSGQWIEGSLPVRPVKNDPQGLGSAISYARRYALAAIVGIAQIDDDANAASGKKEPANPGPSRVLPQQPESGDGFNHDDDDVIEIGTHKGHRLSTKCHDPSFQKYILELEQALETDPHSKRFGGKQDQYKKLIARAADLIARAENGAH